MKCIHEVLEQSCQRFTFRLPSTSSNRHFRHMTQNTAPEIGFQKVLILFLSHSKDGKKAKTSSLKIFVLVFIQFVSGFCADIFRKSWVLK